MNVDFLNKNGLVKEYLKREVTFEHKWIEYNKRHDLKIEKSFYFKRLTPFYGMSYFDQLTEKEKADSYQTYVQFIAELQIFLEKILVYGLFKLRKHEESLNSDMKRSMRLLAKEELRHTNGYMHFLNQQDFSNYLLINNWFLRKSAAFCLGINPLIITLVAAKFEVFSMPYLTELSSSIKDPNDPWLHLNKIHMQDEAFHVPLQFDIYNASIKKFGFIKTIFPMFALYLIFQVVLLIGMRNIIKEVFQGKRFLTKNFMIFPMLVYWAARKMESFQAARVLIKGQFKKKSPHYMSFLRFIFA